MKLNEFRIETYNERMVLAWALNVFECERRYDLDAEYTKALIALKTRVAETQCQPGGCELCSSPEK